VRERIEDGGGDVDRQERDRQQGERAVDLDRQEAWPPRRLSADDRQEAQARDDAEQDQRDDARPAGDEPEELRVHNPGLPRGTASIEAAAPRSLPALAVDSVTASGSSGSGQPPARTTSPSVATRRAARALPASQSSAASPRTIAAVAAVLASTQVAATTEAVRHADSTGSPLRGSTR
jgi:hypothetical protein